MIRPLLAILAPLLLLTACPSYHGADRQSDGSLTLTFIGGYSRSNVTRGAVHAALRAQPDGASVFLADNGALIHADPDAMAIIREKRLTLTCGPRAGCDGDVVLPKPYRRVQP